MKIEMPLYVNPADFLVKMAIDTRLIDKDLSVEALVKESNSKVEKEVRSYHDVIH